MNEKPDVNTKEALLIAAIQVFADKGFDGATVRDICGKAQANVAAVNYHYGGKEALYVAVLEEVFPADADSEAFTDQSQEPEERLRAYLVSLMMEIYEKDSAMLTERWAIFLREMAKPSKNLGFIVQRQVQPRAEELRDILSQLLGPSVSHLTLAFTGSSIWALTMDHLIAQPFLDHLTPKRPDLRSNMEAYIKHVITFTLGGLQALKEKA